MNLETFLQCSGVKVCAENIDISVYTARAEQGRGEKAYENVRGNRAM